MGPDDSHYFFVGKRILMGRVIPFLGAGVNLCAREPGAAWRQGRDLPSGGELAEHLAGAYRYPPNEALDLLRVSQYVDALLGERVLYDELRALFAVDYEPNDVHRFLASLPAALRAKGSPQQLIVTTNYDDVLERALEAAGEAYDLVWYEAKRRGHCGRFYHRPPGGAPALIERPNEWADALPDERPTILKLHGAVDRADADRDSYVITEDNYIDSLARGDLAGQIPATLLSRMHNSHFHFMGYSLRDWNLRVILSRIWGQQKLDLKSWAVQRGVDDLERRLWEERGEVDILDVPLSDYIRRLVDEVHLAAAAPADR
jgi:hypothetical protein